MSTSGAAEYGVGPVLEATPFARVVVSVIEDVDELVESSKCSCNAGDDQPY